MLPDDHPARLLAAEAPALEALPPDALVRRVLDAVDGNAVVLTSFADTVLVDVVTSVAPDVQVATIDTGFAFAETHETRRRAQARHRLELTVVRPDVDAPDLFAVGSEACCAARKVRPMEQLLTGRLAWFSGLRRADHPERAETPIVEIDRRGLLKVNPLVAWSDEDVERYVEERGLIVNPLSFEGYGSIGCWPCTEPGEGREGRWGGRRVECGIHA